MRPIRQPWSWFVNQSESAGVLSDQDENKADEAGKTMTVADGNSAARLPSQEKLLLEYAEKAKRSPQQRGAVHLHLSRLRIQNRRDHHLRIATEVFESKVRDLNGQIFALAGGDLVFAWKGINLDEIDAAADHVRHLFTDDPLLNIDESETQKFCTWFDLERDFAAFHATTAEILANYEKEQQFHSDKSAPRRRPLTPALLGQLEKMMAQADLSNLMRRQSICVLQPGKKPQTVLQELFVSIADVEDSLAKGVELTSDPWLFQRLTLTLDKRMLALMSRQDDPSIASYFSLNLNVATLLDPAFAKFDTVVKSDARGTIALEIPVLEILRDISSYNFARDFARERGYRVCIDGLTQLTAPLMDRETLGFDLMKVYWSADMLDNPKGHRRKALVDTVERCGAARVILCRCDDEQALAFGASLGLAMFQGRVVDKMLREGTVVGEGSEAKKQRAAG